VAERSGRGVAQLAELELADLVGERLTGPWRGVGGRRGRSPPGRQSLGVGVYPQADRANRLGPMAEFIYQLRVSARLTGTRSSSTTSP